MVCLEIANAMKKFVYQKEKPQRIFICAIIKKTEFVFDKRVIELHGDYYEYELMEKYFAIIKCAFLDNAARVEESRSLSHRLQAQAMGFSESTVL